MKKLGCHGSGEPSQPSSMFGSTKGLVSISCFSCVKLLSTTASGREGGGKRVCLLLEGPDDGAPGWVVQELEGLHPCV